MQPAARGGGVALVEDQVEHVQDDPQPLLALRALRQAEGAAGRLDPLLGPADPGRHRGLRHQERAGDLGRGQATDGAQGQCRPGGRGERRMAAQEQQQQRVVGVRDVLGLGRHLGGGRPLPVAARVVAAHLVDQPPAGDGRQPAARVVRYALGRPLQAGGEHGLLDRVLAALEPAVPADQCAEDLRCQFTQQVLDHRYRRASSCHASNCPSANITWRTSTPRPGIAESGICAASSIARSRCSQSTR